MEVKGSTWKLLYTLQSRRSLFLGKALFGIMEVLLVTFLEMGGVFLTGKIYGYTEAFPISQLFYLTGCTLAVELMLFFGAFLLMLLAGNPLLALCAGIIASLTGLFSAFMPKVVSYFVPWGYFVPLGTYEVANWDQAAHTVTYGTRPYNWGLLVFTVVLVMLLVLCSMAKSTETGGVKDVKALYSGRKPKTACVSDLGAVFCTAAHFSNIWNF